MNSLLLECSDIYIILPHYWGVNYFLILYDKIFIMRLKERLKELRTEKRIGQIQLAKETGLSKSAIARWELGISEPTASALVALAKYFNVSVDFLLGLTDY